jgi:hypothetical protein
MRPYSPDTDKGRTRAGDDIHHRTADLPRASAKTVAKAARHGARQDAAGVIAAALVPGMLSDTAVSG